MLPTLCAAVMFFITGIYYERHMKEVTKETEEVMEKATQYSFDGRKESIRSYGSYRFNSIARKYEFSQAQKLNVIKVQRNRSLFTNTMIS